MELSEINPFIRYANTHYYNEPSSQFRFCYDCRAFLIVHGTGTLHVGDTKYPLSNNCFIFLPPETVYKFQFQTMEHLQIIVLDFDLTHLFSEKAASLGTAFSTHIDPEKRFSYPLPKGFDSVFVLEHCHELKAYLTLCVKTFLEKEAYAAMICSAALKLCLAEAAKRRDALNHPETLLTKKVCAYIRNHFHLPEINNETIAKTFHYHPFYLSRAMKETTGKTLHQYLLDYRVYMAKNLLVTTDLSVNLVADRTGFSSCSYFIRQFRAKTGETPLQYRKSHGNHSI